MPKSYRIRTEVGKDKSIKVQLEQDFESLEILSLKILQSDIYNRVCADYGVVVGRITANNGLGLPNCKVSVFIPLTAEDEENPIISELYPYKTLDDVNDDGYRYNLLPYTKSHGGHTPTGTFPSRNDVLTNPTLIEVYDKYYKFTAKTNDSGDFMLFGVPLGSQTIHVDIDLSDIGEFSLSPQDLIRLGIATENQISGVRFNSSNTLDTLPQLLSFNRVIEVYPLWGQPEICELGITRTDFDLSKEAGIQLLPAAIFMGSIISNQDKRAVKRKCRVNRKLGNLCQLIAGPGIILAIRQTIGIDSDGYPVLEEYQLEDGGQVIDDNGAWLIDVPMNLDFVYTNEFGERTFSNDPKVGVPTRARYRFKIDWAQPATIGKVKRASFLVPNIKEWGWDDYQTVVTIGGPTTITSTPDPDNDPYAFYPSTEIKCNAPNPTTDYNDNRFKMVKASYAFSVNWRDYGLTDSANNLTSIGQRMVQEAVECIDRFYEMKYNKVYTVSELISEYRSNSGVKKFISVRDILDETCESTNSPFPANDAQFQFDLLYLLMSILALIAKPILTILIFIAHIVAWAICKIKDFICGLKQMICSSNVLRGFGNWRCNKWTGKCNEWNDKCENQGINLPLLTYPDCELCECTQTDNPTQISSNLSTPTPIPPGSTTSLPQTLSTNYQLGTTTTIPELFNIITLDNPTNFACSDGDGETESTTKRTFTQSIPYSEKMNLFNTKAKFFDEDPTDPTVNPGGGVNRIKVSFNVNATANAGKFHFDNVFAMVMPPLPPDDGIGENPQVVGQGDLIRFSKTQPSTDPNLTYYTGQTISGYNQFGSRGITGVTDPSWVSGSNPDDAAQQGYSFIKTITYANHKINPTTGPEQAAKTVDYEIFGSEESLGGQRFGFDDEYFQVIYTGTVGTFLSQAASEGTSPNSFAHRFLNGGMYFVTNTYENSLFSPTSSTPCSMPPTLPPEICENVNVISQVTEIKRPMDVLPDYSDYRVVFMVRGVDPHSTKVMCKYDLSALFGETLTDDGFFNLTRTEQFMAYQNIPIQPTMRTVKHNLTNSYNSDPYSGNDLFYDTFGFTPDPAQFTPFRSLKPLYYSAIDSTNPGDANLDAYSDNTVTNFINAADNQDIIKINDLNNYNLESWFDITSNYGDNKPDFATYDNSVASGDNDNEYNTPANGRNRGYFKGEIVEGGSLLYIPESTNPMSFTYGGGIFSPAPDDIGCRMLQHYYYGVRFSSPSLGVYIDLPSGGSGRKLVMRSDRLPVSDTPEDTNPNATTNAGQPGALPPTNALPTTTLSMIGFNNPQLDISIIPLDGEVPAIVPPPVSSNQADNIENQQDTENTPISNIAGSFSCDGVVPLECYDVNTAGEVFVQPVTHPCFTNNCCNSSNDSKCYGCDGDKIMAYGCYKLITDPWKSRRTDKYLMNEWLLRLRISFAACRNVWGHMFTNQWVNGTLFAYPLQVQTRYTSPGEDPPQYDSNGNITNGTIGPNQPYSCYCTHLAYFDYQNNNFYYRATPYSETAGYIGRTSDKTIRGGDLDGNRRILGNPTTMMDLGPRNNYMDELSYSDEFQGYVVDRLDSTTFQDVDELLNLFIIQRLVSASIRDIIKTSAKAGANNDPVKRYFSRDNKKVDGDYAQMLAINSQLGVIAFDTGLYTDPNDIFFSRANSDKGVFGVFFSADTQVRDWITPKRTIVSPGSDPTFPCTFDENPIFSQDIPMYLWHVKPNSSGDSIFGDQLNEWDTLPISAGQFNHVNYQSIDRLSTSTPFGSRTMTPNQQDNESYFKGFISNTYNNLTDAAYPSVGGETYFSPRDLGNVGKINNTAPFYFYFGLVKGSSAFDRFTTKWIDGRKKNVY